MLDGKLGTDCVVTAVVVIAGGAEVNTGGMSIKHWVKVGELSRVVDTAGTTAKVLAPLPIPALAEAPMLRSKNSLA